MKSLSLKEMCCLCKPSGLASTHVVWAFWGASVVCKFLASRLVLRRCCISIPTSTQSDVCMPLEVYSYVTNNDTKMTTLHVINPCWQVSWQVTQPILFRVATNARGSICSTACPRLRLVAGLVSTHVSPPGHQERQSTCAAANKRRGECRCSRR